MPAAWIILELGDPNGHRENERYDLHEVRPMMIGSGSRRLQLIKERSLRCRADHPFNVERQFTFETYR